MHSAGIQLICINYELDMLCINLYAPVPCMSSIADITFPFGFLCSVWSDTFCMQFVILNTTVLNSGQHLLRNKAHDLTIKMRLAIYSKIVLQIGHDKDHNVYMKSHNYTQDNLHSACMTKTHKIIIKLKPVHKVRYSTPQLDALIMIALRQSVI